MSSGERPIGAAKGKQIDTEALCHPPPPVPQSWGGQGIFRPCVIMVLKPKKGMSLFGAALPPKRQCPGGTDYPTVLSRSQHFSAVPDTEGASSRRADHGHGDPARDAMARRDAPSAPVNSHSRIEARAVHPSLDPNGIAGCDGGCSPDKEGERKHNRQRLPWPGPPTCQPREDQRLLARVYQGCPPGPPEGRRNAFAAPPEDRPHLRVVLTWAWVNLSRALDRDHWHRVSFFTAADSYPNFTPPHVLPKPKPNRDQCARDASGGLCSWTPPAPRRWRAGGGGRRKPLLSGPSFGNLFLCVKHSP